MSWDDDLFALFDELEHRAEVLYDAERIPELADRSRSQYAAVTLASRLMSSRGRDLDLGVLGIGQVRGELQRVAVQWCLLRGHGQDWVVQIDAITAVRRASERSVPEVAWSPLTRLGFASALRRIADSGQRCVVHLRDGGAHDVVLRRVGADFVEADGSGADGSGAGGLLVAFHGVAAVQSRDQTDQTDQTYQT